MTESEKILAVKSGKTSVRPGDIVEVPVDMAMIHDNNAALTIENFYKINSASVWSPERITLFMDHHSPSTTAKAAKHHDTMRKFAAEHGIKKVHECGCGISHVVMYEEALLKKGEVVVGTDSHTTGEGVNGCFAVGIGASEMAAVLVKGSIWFKVPETVRINAYGKFPFGVMPRDLVNSILSYFGPNGANYCAVEYGGDAFLTMPLDGKIMACVMSAEMGAKNAMVLGNEVTSESEGYRVVKNFNAETLEPTVALPGLPTNIAPISEVVPEKIKVNQAAVASCAGALLSDLAAAAAVLKGRRVGSGVRLLVMPATREIYNRALALGYLSILSDAGAVITSPSCGACGAHDAGILAPGEVCISSSTRNMPGRMGDGGVVYLASSAAVAASAITGYISDPRAFLLEGGC